MLDTLIVSPCKSPLRRTACPACSVRSAKSWFSMLYTLPSVDENELTAVLYASERAIAIGHRRRAVLGSFFVVGATHAIADLAGPGLLRRGGSHNTKRQHNQAEKRCFRKFRN